MDICLQVLKESNKSRFDSHKVSNSVLIISHITCGDCRVDIFSDNLSRNSCIQISNTYLPEFLNILLYVETIKPCMNVSLMFIFSGNF